MNSASISEIKKELQRLDAGELSAICLRLAKYKKENKELDGMFQDLDGRNLYIVKKILRKILRFANRQIKYSGIPLTELELRIYFCEKIKDANISLMAGTVLFNLYQQQLKKITTVLTKLPEDYQVDYASAIEALQ
jgi:hypothetical protein